MNRMFVLPKVVRAFEYCVLRHSGQLYGDLPYFTHPLEVANTVIDPTPNEYISALLHDVVEDTDSTFKDVEDLFGKEVRDTVQLLTKKEALTYSENITRIIDSGNVSAMKVKRADNFVNLFGDKSHMTDLRKAKLVQRYSKSFVRLSDELGL